nr:MAG TPA: hypothetical protein [Caudoviricetes sp.]
MEVNELNVITFSLCKKMINNASIIVTEVKQEITEVKQEVVQVQQEVTAIKDDINSIKEDLSDNVEATEIVNVVLE